MVIPTPRNWTYEENRFVWDDPDQVSIVSDPQAANGQAIRALRPNNNRVCYGPFTSDQSSGGWFKVRFRIKISDKNVSGPVVTLRTTGDWSQYGWTGERTVHGAEFAASMQYRDFEMLVSLPAGSKARGGGPALK